MAASITPEDNWRASSHVEKHPRAIDLGFYDAYVARLAAADWRYEYADDSRVFKAGQAQVQALRTEAKEHPVLQELFDAAARQAPIAVQMSFLDFAAWRRRQISGRDGSRSDVQRLARAVRQLAKALAMAAPDNALPSRAMQLLAELNVLEP